MTPVHLAAMQGNLDILKLMFNLQPDKKATTIHARDANNLTPLHKAVLFDRAVVVQFLIENVSYLSDKPVRFEILSFIIICSFFILVFPFFQLYKKSNLKNLTNEE